MHSSYICSVHEIVLTERSGPRFTTMKSNSDNSEEIRLVDILFTIEFVCWTVVGLCPFLRFINGAAVTTDQWIVQVALFVSSLIGAISLRAYRVFRRL